VFGGVFGAMISADYVLAISVGGWNPGAFLLVHGVPGAVGGAWIDVPGRLVARPRPAEPRGSCGLRYGDASSATRRP